MKTRHFVLASLAGLFVSQQAKVTEAQAKKQVEECFAHVDCAIDRNNTRAYTDPHYYIALGKGWVRVGGTGLLLLLIEEGVKKYYSEPHSQLFVWSCIVQAIWMSYYEGLFGAESFMTSIQMFAHIYGAIGDYNVAVMAMRGTEQDFLAMGGYSGMANTFLCLHLLHFTWVTPYLYKKFVETWFDYEIPKGKGERLVTHSNPGAESKSAGGKDFFDESIQDLSVFWLPSSTGDSMHLNLSDVEEEVEAWLEGNAPGSPA